MTGTDGGTDGGTARVCPMPMTTADAGMLSAAKTQLCNFPGSMGKQHWYRIYATLPGSTMNYVQLEFYDQLGVFAGGTVKTGTFKVDTDPATCGVCVRGMGDKGAADAKEYFATTGSVTITAVGAAGMPLTATFSNLGFVELDSTRKPVSGGCTATVTAGQISGTVMQQGGTGGGGGGGGGGAGMCSQNIGE